VKLLDFQRYFNGHRTHAGLGGLTPEPRTDEDTARASVSQYRWRPAPLSWAVSDADRGMTDVRRRIGLNPYSARCRPIERHACVLVPDCNLATIRFGAGLIHRSDGFA
jgi:hypothetical protein